MFLEAKKSCTSTLNLGTWQLAANFKLSIWNVENQETGKFSQRPNLFEKSTKMSKLFSFS